MERCADIEITFALKRAFTFNFILATMRREQSSMMLTAAGKKILAKLTRPSYVTPDDWDTNARYRTPTNVLTTPMHYNTVTPYEDRSKASLVL
jgi:hypothetical protein